MNIRFKALLAKAIRDGRENPSAIDTIFLSVMDQSERDAFDKMLIDMDHHLADEGGTQRERFKKYILEQIQGV